ncbi:C40 family peptidase [Rahnella sp. PAMC25617]|uniref:C40 family peptidase n=1 Tax=Rahnella TaxID=34037 RepID=UPI00133052E9|nr:NlpC/P60 family protein [Rahnella variigena]
MFRIKSLVSALLLLVAGLFSTHSFAFDMPKEFESMDTYKFFHSELFDGKGSSVTAVNTGNSENIKSALLAEYPRWKGTHYRWGGTTHKGVDCSALMQHLFRDSLQKRLPRTTFQQIRNGRKVSKNSLKPGDLVFFKTSPGDRHVGVYVGDHQFIHASKIEGVTISSLDNQYWVDHYETARRLELMS